MIRILFLAAGAITMIVMSLHYFSHTPSGILIGKSIADTVWYPYLLQTHIALGILAMCSGLAQFIPKWTKRWHRPIGVLYSICVAGSGTMALLIAPFAIGGWIAGLGFSMLAVVWLTTTIVGIRYAMKGSVKKHRKWMIASYALTFAAIPQRTMLLIPLLTTVPFIPIYRLSAWLPWLLNLTIAYFIIQPSKTTLS